MHWGEDCNPCSCGKLERSGYSVVKLRLRENEHVSDAVKRFRKLVEFAGIKKEMRRRQYYEKPSDVRRRSRRRAEQRARSAQIGVRRESRFSSGSGVDIPFSAREAEVT